MALEVNMYIMTLYWICWLYFIFNWFQLFPRPWWSSENKWPGVVAFLDDQIGDWGLVVGVQLRAGRPHGPQLEGQHLHELALRDAVPKKIWVSIFFLGNGWHPSNFLSTLLQMFGQVPLAWYSYPCWPQIDWLMFEFKLIYSFRFPAEMCILLIGPVVQNRFWGSLWLCQWLSNILHLQIFKLLWFLQLKIA